MYLSAIYRISLVRPEVRSIHVAEQLGFSKPSVSRALSILKENGYLTIEKHNFIHLTDLGYTVAKKIYDRNVLLEYMLVTMGVDKETASADACKMEHAISDTSYAAIKKYLNFESN